MDSSYNIYKERQNNGVKSEKVNENLIIKSFAEHKFNLQSSCYKLFDRKIIDNNNLKFNINIYHGEDGLFVFEYLQHVKGIIYENIPLWNILERELSATRSPYNKNWLTAIDAAEIICKKNLKVESNRIYLQRYYTERVYNVEFAALKTKNASLDDCKLIRKKIRKYSRQFLVGNISLKSKIIFIIISFSPLKVSRFICMKINRK